MCFVTFVCVIAGGKLKFIIHGIPSTPDGMISNHNTTVHFFIRRISNRGILGLLIPLISIAGYPTPLRSGFFDPMAVQMVTIGEEIGELSNMFKRLNAFYQEYIDVFLTRFTSMFEPLMLVFMGVVIGIMVIGMFLPIFQITQIR